MPIILTLPFLILFAILVVAFLALSAITFARHRPRISLACLLLASFFAKLPGTFDPAIQPWDERYHALVAKHLAEHPLQPTLIDSPPLPYDYRDWQENHIWLHKPPMALWTIALSLKLLGLSPFALRLPSLLFSLAAILLTYAIGSRLFDLRTGLIAAWFHTLCAPLIALAIARQGMDHVDTAMIFFIELGIYFAVRQSARQRFAWLIAIACALAAAILTKWLAGLLIIVVWQMLPARIPALRRLAQAAIVLAIAAALVLPWYLHLRHAFPAEFHWEQSYNLQHFTRALEGHAHPFYYYFALLPVTFGVCAPIAIFLFLWRTASARRHPAMPSIAAWFLVTYVLFSIARTRLIGYTLIAAPAVFLISAWFYWQVYDRLPKVRWPQTRPIVLAILLLAPIVPGFFALRFHRSRADQQLLDICLFLRTLPTKIPNDRTVFFNVQHPTELMFYTPFTAYRRLPTPDDLRELQKSHHPIFLCQDPAYPLPLRLRNNTALTVFPVPSGF